MAIVELHEAPPMEFDRLVATRRLRMALIDRDSGFARVVNKRLSDLGGNLIVRETPVPVADLVTMRVDAVVIDVAVTGPLSSEWMDAVRRRMPDIALVVCASSSTLPERVRALRQHADAWLTKPCHPEELIWVVAAAVRSYRRSVLTEAPPITVGGILLRPDRYQAYVGELSLDLTTREFELLYALTRSAAVQRREDIYRAVWGYEMGHGDRSVDAFVRKIRAKLRDASPEWEYIHTHVGVGYRFGPQQARRAA